MAEIINDIINEYDNLGYAKKINNNTLESINKECTIELESNDNNTITIYSNGTLIQELSYNDKNFIKKLNILLSGELNI